MTYCPECDYDMDFDHYDICSRCGISWAEFERRPVPPNDQILQMGMLNLFKRAPTELDKIKDFLVKTRPPTPIREVKRKFTRVTVLGKDNAYSTAVDGDAEFEVGEIREFIARESDLNYTQCKELANRIYNEGKYNRLIKFKWKIKDWWQKRKDRKEVEEIKEKLADPLYPRNKSMVWGHISDVDANTKISPGMVLTAGKNGGYKLCTDTDAAKPIGIAMEEAKEGQLLKVRLL